MEVTHLRYSIQDAVATVTINRPDKLNALNADLLAELEELFEAIENDTGVRAVVLTGEGRKSFAAGADIQQFTALGAVDGHHFARRGQAVFNQIENLSKPVIAAINGFALGGGCELAMACHIRIASDTARLGQPEVDLGILPGYGGTQRLPRLVGKGLATELILTGEQVSAERAAEIGLVNRVVDAEDLWDEVQDVARSIAEKAPHAVRLALQALRASDLPLEKGQHHEAALFGEALSTEDAAEGAQAFLDKRKPEFKGR